MAKTQKDYSIFPSQAVSDSQKRSSEYGLEVAKAIEHEWFHDERGTNRYRTYKNDFHNLIREQQFSHLYRNCIFPQPPKQF